MPIAISLSTSRSVIATSAVDAPFATSGVFGTVGMIGEDMSKVEIEEFRDFEVVRLILSGIASVRMIQDDDSTQ